MSEAPPAVAAKAKGPPSGERGPGYVSLDKETVDIEVAEDDDEGPPCPDDQGGDQLLRLRGRSRSRSRSRLTPPQPVIARPKPIPPWRRPERVFGPGESKPKFPWSRNTKRASVFAPHCSMDDDDVRPRPESARAGGRGSESQSGSHR